MEHVNEILSFLGERLKTMAKANAVTAKPISAGDRHVMPLCELSLGFGGGGGTGEGLGEDEQKENQGTGGGVGGAAKATPVAVVIADGDDVRIEVL
jgi:uncharacterized spore protein YtfJ